MYVCVCVLLHDRVGSWWSSGRGLGEETGALLSSTKRCGLFETTEGFCVFVEYICCGA